MSQISSLRGASSTDNNINREEKSMDVDLKYSDLSKAIRKNNKSTIHYSSRTRVWLKNATDVEKICHQLHRVIVGENVVEFNKLLDKFDLYQLESAKWTPLMTCVQQKRVDFTKSLLRRGASVHTRDPQKRVVLHVACNLGCISMARLLLTHNYNNLNIANIRNNADHSPVYSNDPNHSNNHVHSSFSNHNTKINTKHPNRSDINVRDREDNTPLILATKGGHSELIKLILLNKNLHGQNINVNLYNSSGQTALHIACERGHLQIVQNLLGSKHIMVNLRDNKGHTPLQRAVRRHRYDIVKMLLRNGKISKYGISNATDGINIQCNNGMTALMVAAQTRDNKMLELLLFGEFGILDKEKKMDEIDSKRRNRMNRLGINGIDSSISNTNDNGIYHQFWLKTYEKKRDVLYYLKKYKCDVRIYNYVLKQLRNIVEVSLCVYDPQMPYDISRFIATMTY